MSIGQKIPGKIRKFTCTTPTNNQEWASMLRKLESQQQYVTIRTNQETQCTLPILSMNNTYNFLEWTSETKSENVDTELFINTQTEFASDAIKHQMQEIKWKKNSARQLSDRSKHDKQMFVPTLGVLDPENDGEQ